MVPCKGSCIWFMHLRSSLSQARRECRTSAAHGRQRRDAWPLRLLHGRERLLQARRLNTATAAQLSRVTRRPGWLQAWEALLLLLLLLALKLLLLLEHGE